MLLSEWPVISGFSRLIATALLFRLDGGQGASGQLWAMDRWGRCSPESIGVLARFGRVEVLDYQFR